VTSLEIVDAVNDDVIGGNPIGCIFGVNPFIVSDNSDFRIERSRELARARRLWGADVFITINRLALKV